MRVDAASAQGDAVRFALSDRVALLAIWALWAGHAAANFVWLKVDTRPPFYDMAGHAVATLSILHLPFLTNFPAAFEHLFRINLYPPLVYWLAAPLAAIFWPTVDVITAINTLFLGVLIFSTYAITLRFSDPVTGLLAAFIVSMYPDVYGLSRLYLLDLPVSAMTALGVWLLLRTNHFESRGGSFWFGIAAGLGMLTKWTFVLYLAGPILVVGIEALRRYSRRKVINFAAASLTGLAVMAPWYLNNIPQLQFRMYLNANDSAVMGFPIVGTLDSWLYYVRALVTNQILLPLTLAWGVCLIMLLVMRTRSPGTMLLFAWVAVSFAGLSLLDNKDARYAMAYLPAVAAMTALVLMRLQPVWLRRGLVAVLVVYCLIEFTGLTWGLSRRLPAGVLATRVVLFGEPSLPIYNENVDLASPAEAQDWKEQVILRDMQAISSQGQSDVPIKLTVIPNAPYFEPNIFEYFALAEARRITVRFVASTLPVPDALARLLDSDFIVAKTGYQGPAYALQQVELWNELLRDRSSELGRHFVLVASYGLPDRSTAQLYRRVD